jgi:uncharacterized protein (UPF0303 family)
MIIDIRKKSSVAKGCKFSNNNNNNNNNNNGFSSRKNNYVRRILISGMYYLLDFGFEAKRSL